MKISNITYSPSFKSVYPVVTHVNKENGQEIQVTGDNLNKSLLTKLVKILTGSIKRSKKDENSNLALRAFNYLSRKDSDYLKNTKSISIFKSSSYKKEYTNYLITGHDSDEFKEYIAKPLGVAKYEYEAGTPEYREGVKRYNSDGLRFIRSKCINRVLHVWFDEKTNPKTNEKEYVLSDMKMPIEL